MNPFVTDVWANTVSAMEREFKHGFPDDFLQHELLRNHLMFEAAKEAFCEWAWLNTKWSPAELEKLLYVEPFGHPFPYKDWDGQTPPQTLEMLPQWTTRTTIHHLYHLTMWMELTNKTWTDVHSVVEWGGGFGNMAKMIRRLNPTIEYTIVDLPIMNKVQDHYLRGVGEQNVCLVPIDEVDQVQDHQVFISTWALCESTMEAQNYVHNRGYFGAEHFLIATQRLKQEFPDSVHFWDLIQHKGKINFAMPASSCYVIS